MNDAAEVKEVHALCRVARHAPSRDGSQLHLLTVSGHITTLPRETCPRTRFSLAKILLLAGTAGAGGMACHCVLGSLLG